MHICISKLSTHWFVLCLASFLASGHYLTQSDLVFRQPLEKKINEIATKEFSVTKIIWKWRLQKWRSFCRGLTGFIACFLSIARSKLWLCSANHRPGYFSNLACGWLSIIRYTSWYASLHIHCWLTLQRDIWKISQRPSYNHDCQGNPIYNHRSTLSVALLDNKIKDVNLQNRNNVFLIS